MAFSKRVDGERPLFLKFPCIHTLPQASYRSWLMPGICIPSDILRRFSAIWNSNGACFSDVIEAFMMTLDACTIITYISSALYKISACLPRLPDGERHRWCHRNLIFENISFISAMCIESAKTLFSLSHTHTINEIPSKPFRAILHVMMRYFTWP